MELLFENFRGSGGSPYGVFVILAMAFSLFYWSRASSGGSRMLPIYLGALGGAFLGAKLSYVIAEGWLHRGPDWWVHWLYGKSITGALFGGYFGVEFGKSLVKYREPTGDRFALIVPLSIVLGRLGCLGHGCCQGVTFANGFHWPAVPIEIAFNITIWVIFLTVRKISKLQNQLFYLYLISYGIFRFFHEFLRGTPKVFFGCSGYQFVALMLVLLGAVGFQKRKNHFDRVAEP